MHRYKFFLKFLIIITIFGLIIFSATLFAAAKEEELTEENILSKISLAAQWLSEQQRPDGRPMALRTTATRRKLAYSNSR